jgi:N-acetylglutamate synthase-like GNAT family acetyltransferase
MQATGFNVRRATLEDIPTLLTLWKSMQYPADELARNVTGFQVVVDAEGALAGALGFEVLGKQGRIHSEAFVDFAWADQFRPMLWGKIITLANNHGLTRLWTREQSPFYKQQDMVPPNDDAMKLLPPQWQVGTGAWFTIKLREELDTLLKADQEFALFMAAEKERTQQAIERGKLLKVFATVIAVALCALVLAGIFYIAQRGHVLRR